LLERLCLLIDEGPIRRPEWGESEWEPIKILLEGDRNSNKTNSLGRTPKITRSALLPSVFQNHVATKVLLVLGTNTNCSHSSYTHSTAETTRKLSSQQGRFNRGKGAVKPPAPWQIRNPPKHLFRASKLSTFSPTGSSGQGQASYQRILAKTKTSPKGPRGG
jgi:hypothetical protein